MKDFAGRTAVITGGGTGMGRELARQLVAEGCNVAMCDVSAANMAETKALCVGAGLPQGMRVTTHVADVSDEKQLVRFRDEMAEEHKIDHIHLLFNNAGVSLGAAPLWELTAAQWEWIFGVNIFGVINGIKTMVPRMRRHGERGHVVNTASIGGLQVNAKLRNGSYAMTKYAVVAASEALALDLEDSNLGVSVLCPALVATTLHASSQRRPARLGGPYQHPGAETAKAWQSAGLSPDDVGRRVLDAVSRAEFFIFTHEEPRAWIEERHARLLAGFDSITRYNAGKDAT